VSSSARKDRGDAAALRDQLKEIESRIGLKGDHLARALRVSRKTVNDWLKGRASPSVSEASRIGRLLVISRTQTLPNIGKYIAMNIQCPVLDDKSFLDILSAPQINVHRALSALKIVVRLAIKSKTKLKSFEAHSPSPLSEHERSATLDEITGVVYSDNIGK